MSLVATIIVLFFQIITFFLFTTTTASSSPLGGITIDLIHRRSNFSFPRPSDTGDGSSPYANTVFDKSEYLMKLQIGAPPVEIEAVLDTGSGIIWTQCLPCLHCYDQTAPIFDPSKSSTYKEKQCANEPDHVCHYEAAYAGGLNSKGTFATETVTIQSTSGKPFVMAGTTIGCGHDNTGDMSPASSGIVGLDWGSSSLISQMGGNYPGLFSYCFSGKGTSKINFGANAVVAGGTVATTIYRKNGKNFYYLNLDAISVGNSRIETLGTPFHSSDGNIIIDSGTTNTYLPESYCNMVKDAVSNAVKAEPAPFTGDLLCYTTNDIKMFPAITMHFSGGADLALDNYNMYVENGGGVTCLGIVCGGPNDDAFFGNRAQNNWLIGYDTSSEVISFKSTDCSALYG
ncbi:unnamed protein product [Thlaspi arvense]|uniref:Peptidase A1 domain-containing protein n=1 Tax=Thlaspi arvense TaxID=13288 RepID=A0AAU9S6Q0_THLAR|nr:unnamed protein product [Thlaspi arvense]